MFIDYITKYEKEIVIINGILKDFYNYYYYYYYYKEIDIHIILIIVAAILYILDSSTLNKVDEITLILSVIQGLRSEILKYNNWITEDGELVPV